MSAFPTSQCIHKPFLSQPNVDALNFLPKTCEKPSAKAIFSFCLFFVLQNRQGEARSACLKVFRHAGGTFALGVVGLHLRRHHGISRRLLRPQVSDEDAAAATSPDLSAAPQQGPCARAHGTRRKGLSFFKWAPAGPDRGIMAEKMVELRLRGQFSSEKSEVRLLPGLHRAPGHVSQLARAVLKAHAERHRGITSPTIC